MNSEISEPLPGPLVESEDYKGLNADQKRNFLARLRYCEEIAEKGVAAASISDAELFNEIDDIELDALSIMSDFGKISTTVSQYKVHSSWTFECEHASMAQYVLPEAKDLLYGKSIDLTATHVEAKSWLRQWSRALSLTIEKFRRADSFSEVITHLIVIDALVSSYLIFAAIVRLGGKIYS